MLPSPIPCETESEYQGRPVYASAIPEGRVSPGSNDSRGLGSTIVSLPQTTCNIHTSMDSEQAWAFAMGSVEVQCCLRHYTTVALIFAFAHTVHARKSILSKIWTHVNIHDLCPRKPQRLRLSIPLLVAHNPFLCLRVFYIAIEMGMPKCPELHLWRRPTKLV